MGVSSAIGTYDSCCVSEFRCMQAITADTVNAYNITHDDQPNMSSASSLHGAKRRGGLWDGIYFAYSRGYCLCQFSAGGNIRRLLELRLCEPDAFLSARSPHSRSHRPLSNILADYEFSAGNYLFPVSFSIIFPTTVPSLGFMYTLK